MPYENKTFGVMEFWNNGIRQLPDLSIPLFHFSNIPGAE